MGVMIRRAQQELCRTLYGRGHAPWYTALGSLALGLALMGAGLAGFGQPR